MGRSSRILHHHDRLARSPNLSRSCSSRIDHEKHERERAISTSANVGIPGIDGKRRPTRIPISRGDKGSRRDKGSGVVLLTRVPLLSHSAYQAGPERQSTINDVAFSLPGWNRPLGADTRRATQRIVRRMPVEPSKTLGRSCENRGPWPGGSGVQWTVPVVSIFPGQQWESMSSRLWPPPG